LLAFIATANAQPYPNKPIKVSSDRRRQRHRCNHARGGQTSYSPCSASLVIENRGGAPESRRQSLRASRADGYTVCIIIISTLRSIATQQAAYDADNDFVRLRVCFF